MHKIKLSVCVFILLFALGFVGIALTDAADFSGVWQGTWTSTYGNTNNLSASITQTGTTLSGTLGVNGTDCGDFSNLSLSGTVSGDTASFQSDAYCAGDSSDNELGYTNAIISGNTMAGIYTIYSDGEFWDSGVFSLTKTSTDRSSVESFVTRFYQQCLSREPEQAGLNNWADALINGTQSGADVANGFIFSQEFINRNTSNEEFVTISYRAFFNREPDAGGYNYWLNQLISGINRQSVLNGFIYSQEFENLCNSYGISPYSA